MRQTTRNKWYGRIAADQTLQVVSVHLSEAIKLADEPTPFTQKLDQVLKELQDARDQIVNHNMGRKRLINRIEIERQRIIELIADIKHIPIFQDEKAAATVERYKKNDLAASTPKKHKAIRKKTKKAPAKRKTERCHK